MQAYGVPLMPSSTTLTLDSRIRPGPEVVSGQVANEAVLVMPSQAKVRMLNEVGSRIWALAADNLTLREIADTLIAEYDIAPDLAAADVLAFAQELANADLVEITP